MCFLAAPFLDMSYLFGCLLWFEILLLKKTQLIHSPGNDKEVAV